MPKRILEEKEIDIANLQEYPGVKSQCTDNTLYRRGDHIVKFVSNQTRRWCHHDVRHERCKSCAGSAICKHNVIRAQCKQCIGSRFCDHGIRRTACKKCEGSSFCEHKIQRAKCKQCAGSSICEHTIEKPKCYRCSAVSHPDNFCPLCKMVYTHQRAYDKYERHCAKCFQFLHPDADLPRRTHLKEDELAKFLYTHYGTEKWTRDSKLRGGCSARRPDFVHELITHVIDVENDEFGHRDRDKECENRRAMEIYQDIAFRPLVCIRFNPDFYVDADGVRHQGCFSYSSTGALIVDKVLFADRCVALVIVIDKYLLTVPDKAYTEEFLFYSEDPHNDDEE